MLPGDLALRKAIRDAYQLDGLPNEQEVLAIAEKWRPFRSLAMSYLFASAFDRDKTEARPGNVTGARQLRSRQARKHDENG